MPRKKIIEGPAFLWKRIAALVADLLIINLVIVFPFQGILEKLIPQGLSMSGLSEFFNNNPETAGLATSIIVVIGILAMIYFSIMEYKTKQTIGKKLFSIFVVSETKELKLWQCFVRNLHWFLFAPFILLWIIDPIYMLFNKESKRLTEVLSKTKVIQQFKVV